MSRPATPPSLLDAALRLDSIPAAGRRLAVEATPAQRAAIAERLGILSVDHLRAELTAMSLRGGIRVTGQLDAAVTQECVVSFQPVPETISEPLDRVFLPGGGDSQPAPGSEVFVDLEGEDQPDHFEGPEVDFSEYLVETLSLALNPYPRIPGAKVEDDRTFSDDEAPESPFASLKSLKSEGD